MKLYSIIFAGFIIAGMWYGAAGVMISLQPDEIPAVASDCRLVPQEVSYSRSKGWISRDAARFYGTKSSLTVRIFSSDSKIERIKRRAEDCQEIYEEHVIQSVLDTEIL